MKTIRVKIKDDNYQAIEKMLEKIDKSRIDYLSDAIDFYNKYQRRLWLEKQFALDVSLIGESSMEVLREMENLDPHLLDEWEDDISNQT